jgi:hypothetical protein
MSPDYLSVLDDDLGAMLGVDFKTDGREVTDYAVVLLLEVGDATQTASTTGLMGTTRFIATPVAPASRRERHFIAVPLVKEGEQR